MKKPRDLNSKVQRRLALSRFRSRLAEKAKRAERRKLGLPRLPFGTGYPGLPTIGGGWSDLAVPKSLDLIAGRQATCQFFEQVRDQIRDGNRLRLVFQESDHISSESLIYLLAQMHKVRLRGPDRITGTYPKSARVERLLSSSGFFKILGVRSRNIPGRPLTATRFVKCRSDTVIKPALIPELRDELLGDDLAMPPSVAKLVYRAVSEAMANVQHHAYQSKHLRLRALRGRWWMGAQLSVRKNYFELTFYDAGVGIPRTLHRQYAWEHIRGVLSLLPGIDPDDAQMIKAAVELGRTRTRQDNRGKGLLDIHQIIDKIGAGALTILSRHGSYRYERSGETTFNDANFVEGTLIKWELPLDLVVSSTVLNAEA